MSKKISKILAVLMAVAMIACVFASCSDSSTKENPSAADASAADASDAQPVAGKVYKVGICQLVQHDALDAATNGFMDALKAKLGDNVEFDLQNAANDSATCATITNNFVSDGVDLIMANATPALQAAMAATADIPIVATSITDFATALDIDDWTGKTGTNVTGTADLAPLDEQAKMIQELLPDAKTVAILYCSGEPNSKYQATVVEQNLDALGLAYKEYTVADSNEVASVVTQACEEADCIYIPTDNTMASTTEAINEVASAKNIPIIAGEEGICKGCGIATLSISYYSIGYAAGEMAYDILINGTNPGDMDIQYSTELTKKYVADRCAALGVTVPETYEAIEMSAE